MGHADMNHTTEPRGDAWRLAAKRLSRQVEQDTPTGHFTEWPCDDGDTVLTWTQTQAPSRHSGGYDWAGAGVA